MMIYIVTSDTKDADGFFNQVNNYNLPIFTYGWHCY